MLFRAYVDDSTEEKVRIFTVGGFVGADDAWENLEPEWPKLLPAGISHFHATDCFTGNREFKGMSRANRESLLDSVLALHSRRHREDLRQPFALPSSTVLVDPHVAEVGEKELALRQHQHVSPVGGNIRGVIQARMAPEKKKGGGQAPPTCYHVSEGPSLTPPEVLKPQAG
jgi:hypothetical protein